MINKPSIVKDSLYRRVRTMKNLLTMFILVLICSISYNFWAAQNVKAINQNIKHYKSIVAARDKQIAELKKTKPVINNYYTIKSKPQEIYVTVSGDGNINVSTDSPGVNIITRPVVKEVIKPTIIESPKTEPVPEPTPTPHVQKYWPNGEPMWDPYPGIYDNQGKEVGK